MAENARPMRFCDVCLGYDDHPRHTVWVGPGGDEVETAQLRRLYAAAEKLKLADDDAGLATAVDRAWSERHMDCCAEVGCPDGSCDAVVAEAKGKTGDKLVSHLEKMTPDAQEG